MVCVCVFNKDHLCCFYNVYNQRGRYRIKLIKALTSAHVPHEGDSSTSYSIMQERDCKFSLQSISEITFCSSRSKSETLQVSAAYQVTARGKSDSQRLESFSSNINVPSAPFSNFLIHYLLPSPRNRAEWHSRSGNVTMSVGGTLSGAALKQRFEVLVIESLSIMCVSESHIVLFKACLVSGLSGVRL